MIRAWTAAVLLAPWAGAWAAGEDAAWAWMDKMRRALQGLNYHGILVYVREGRMESLRIAHRFRDGRETERLVQLTGSPREIVRQGDRVTCFMPDKRAVVVGHRRLRGNPLARLASARRLEDYYRLEVDGVERVAGQPARRLSVVPRDRFRYGYRLWVAEENGLPLRSDLLDDGGRALEQLMFASVEVVDEVPDELLEPSTASDGYRWLDQLGEPAGAEALGRWRDLPMPPGFAVENQFRHPMPGGGEPADHLLVSDGLASVSVFVERSAAGVHKLDGVARVGAAHAFGLPAGAYHVTVVGEVPPVTVRRIAEAVAARLEEAP